MVKYAVLSLLLMFSCVQKKAVNLPKPLLNAHAHNDYQHERPLFDALSYGFTSIEADIHLINDTLFVAHGKEDINSEKTLENLYLRPLYEIAENNDAYIYAENIPFVLLIDIKSDADSTYHALNRVLANYQNMLTFYNQEKVTKGAVTIIISGNRPLQLMKNENPRYTAYDGRPGDLKEDMSDHLIPLISANWNDYFKWKGDGQIPENEGRKLAELVKTAHKQGRKVRFWATDVISGNQQNFWRTLLAYKVDYIGTDKLKALRDFLIKF